MSLADNTWALAKVLEDAVLKGRQGKAVLLNPRSSTPSPMPISSTTAGWDQIYAIMQDLIAADVVIVTCAGDGPMRRPRKDANVPDRVPAIWASRAFPIIVAGAVTNDGNYAKFTQGVDITQNIAWAPGDGVACASNLSSRDQKGQGTAFAAGMVMDLRSFAALVKRRSYRMLTPSNKRLQVLLLIFSATRRLRAK